MAGAGRMLSGMRRADRLFLLIQALRGRRVVTARRLAEQLEVSERTIYRDVRDLQLSGIPIEGEAGVGYCLRRGSDIPPLMFNREELEALVVGARLVAGWTTPALSSAARQALTKIEGVIPEELLRELNRSRIFVPPAYLQQDVAEQMQAIHAAIESHNVLQLDYRREDGEASLRRIWPLCLAFWGARWTVGAWCELRRDFRNFRLDRIVSYTVLDEGFEETPDIGLNAYLRSVGATD